MTLLLQNEQWQALLGFVQTKVASLAGKYQAHRRELVAGDHVVMVEVELPE